MMEFGFILKCVTKKLHFYHFILTLFNFILTLYLQTKKKHLYLTFVDLEKAFDKVSRDVV